MSRSISGFVVLLSTCVSLSAQWVHYPTPGIPRTPDGKPNLLAPAPKTPDGKPDLSGIWNIEDDPGQTQFLDLAPSVKGGLPYRPGMAELAMARRAPPKTSEPITRCLPGSGAGATPMLPKNGRSGTTIPGNNSTVYDRRFSLKDAIKPAVIDRRYSGNRCSYKPCRSSSQTRRVEAR